MLKGQFSVLRVGDLADELELRALTDCADHPVAEQRLTVAREDAYGGGCRLACHGPSALKVTASLPGVNAQMFLRKDDP